MRNFSVLSYLLAIALATCGSRARAVDFESFNFSDPDGLELDQVANTANPGNVWTVDIANLVPAETVGGVYRITKDTDTTAAGVLNIANVTTGTRYIAVDMAGWAFRGFDAAEPEELRFGFLDNDDGAFTGNLVTAQMQLRRNTTTQGVELFGDASGPGSSNLTRTATLGADQSAPFKMVLQLDKTANTYEVFYKDGASPSQSLGIGNIVATRNGNSVRLFVNNNFGSDGSEFISVDRIAVADVNPLADLLTFEVNRTSGEMKLINTTGAALSGLESYSILSLSGALNSANWKTIAGNYDFAGDKTVDVDNNWNVTVANVGEFTEAVVSGNGGALAVNQQVVLSKNTGPWIKNPNEDLFMILNFAGGVTRTANVNFVGNSGKRFRVADLNFDGALTAADWTVFITNSETDLAGLSGPQRYQRGDLDGDGVNSTFDFIAFKSAYEAVNGPGAFEAMLAQVPEPASVMLVSLAAASLVVARRRCRCAACIALLATMTVAPRADAGILQDFTFNDPNGTTIESAANSVNPTNLWLTQNNMVESSVQSGKFRINKQTVAAQVGNTLDIADVSTGKIWLVAEIAGWNFTATASSPTAERVRLGFLDNSVPTAGSNTITAEMNIDRLTADNSIVLSGEALGTGASNITTDFPLPLVRSTPFTMVLEVDKALDQYTVYYKDNTAPFATLGFANLGASIANPGDRDANSVRFAFTGQYGEPGEFFDVERIYVTDTNPVNVSADALTLRVDTTTGSSWIVNASATPFTIDLYRIESAANRLTTTGWNSFSEQNFGAIDGPDPDAIVGNGIGETWDESGGSDSNVLSESFLLGSSAFAAMSPPVSIGAPYTPGTQTPLVFQYRNKTTGAVVAGNVEFISTVADADFNNNNVVEGFDFLTWQRSFGGPGTPTTGDANGDGAVNAADYQIWRTQFGGAPPQTAALTAVPEPGAALLALMALLVGVRQSRYANSLTFSTARHSSAKLRAASSRRHASASA